MKKHLKHQHLFHGVLVAGTSCALQAQAASVPRVDLETFLGLPAFALNDINPTDGTSQTVPDSVGP